MIIPPPYDLNSIEVDEEDTYVKTKKSGLSWSALQSSLSNSTRYEFERTEPVDYFDHKQRYLIAAAGHKQQHLAELIRVKLTQTSTFYLLDDLCHDLLRLKNIIPQSLIDICISVNAAHYSFQEPAEA